jgi:hypothetical protein
MSRRLLSLLLWLLPCLAHAQAGEKMAVVEIIGPGQAPVAAENLLKLCQKYQISTTGVYRWQNHLIAYGKAVGIQALQKNLAAVYAGKEVKFYAAPFYKFDRHYCPDKTTAKQWDNIVLTANLVKDPAKQQEYLNYHATQFQKWPEVAQGFCNASFQQLLVFRQGRQLMLVISIPHGASLDELNPKTSLNNPRGGINRTSLFNDGRGHAPPLHFSKQLNYYVNPWNPRPWRRPQHHVGCPKQPEMET